jgi:glycosyltransferase
VALLSIIIPSFNDPRIANAIASVRRFDDCGRVQIVVVDGGSAAGLLEQVGSLVKEGDILISEPDKGIFDALNKGLERAEGEFIGWLGSDDIFTPAVKSSEVIDALAEVDLFIGGTMMLRGNRVSRALWLSRYPVRAAYLGLHNPHFSTFGRAALLRRERFTVDCPVADIDYFLRIFKNNPSVNVDRRTVTLMQLGGFSNASLASVIAHNREVFRIYRSYVSLPQAAVALLLKTVPKLVSVFFYQLRTCRVQDELIELQA